jgi:hypothetical protein
LHCGYVLCFSEPSNPLLDKRMQYLNSLAENSCRKSSIQ